MTAAEAIEFVRAKRGIICPNAGFRNQLAIYSEQFVGNRAKRVDGIATTRAPRVSKRIAERIRRLKSGAAGPTSTAVLDQVEIARGA